MKFFCKFPDDGNRGMPEKGGGKKFRILHFPFPFKFAAPLRTVFGASPQADSPLLRRVGAAFPVAHGRCDSSTDLMAAAAERAGA